MMMRVLLAYRLIMKLRELKTLLHGDAANALP